MRTQDIKYIEMKRVAEAKVTTKNVYSGRRFTGIQNRFKHEGQFFFSFRKKCNIPYLISEIMVETWLESTWRRIGVNKGERTLKIMVSTCGMWHFCVSDLPVTGWPRQGWYWERPECLESCAPEFPRLHLRSSWTIRSILMYNEMKAKSRIKGSSFSATDCVFTLSTLFSPLSGC